MFVDVVRYNAYANQQNAIPGNKTVWPLMPVPVIPEFDSNEVSVE